MAIIVRTCCCGCDLRTGILLIGIFGLIGSGYSLYSEYRSYKILSDYKKESAADPTSPPVAEKYVNIIINMSYAGIAFAAISLLVNLCLLASYGMRNRFLALPWVLWSLFGLLYNLGATIFFLVVWNTFAYLLVGSILAWVLSIYFIIVVFSYMEALREDPSGGLAGFPSDTMIRVGGPAYAKFP